MRNECTQNRFWIPHFCHRQPFHFRLFDFNRAFATRTKMICVVRIEKKMRDIVYFASAIRLPALIGLCRCVVSRLGILHCPPESNAFYSLRILWMQIYALLLFFLVCWYTRARHISHTNTQKSHRFQSLHIFIYSHSIYIYPYDINLLWHKQENLICEWINDEVDCWMPMLVVVFGQCTGTNKNLI